MKLYYAPGACSMSPHIALQESGLKFSLEKLDFATRKVNGVDFSSINPKGYVPALQLDDGQVLTEGPAIIQYIADKVPERKLAPAAGSFERYRLMEWLNYITAELHKPIGSLFNPTLPDTVKQGTIQNIIRRFGYVDGVLAGKTYLMGDTYTVADGYLFWTISAAMHLKIDLSAFAALQQYHARVAARPAVQAALKAEGLAH
ncbi:MAG TPA: glutathione transferase GstA [Steroidobacteraceae bacterium]|nr:glutathione transferase GstA [Steroidobacteraceae bacterium]